MDPITMMMLGGAGMGLLKSMGQQGDADRNRKLQAELARNSTWSSMRPDLSGVSNNPNFLANMGSGAMTGASFGAANPGLLAGAPGGGSSGMMLQPQEMQQRYGGGGLGLFSDAQPQSNGLLAAAPLETIPPPNIPVPQQVNPSGVVPNLAMSTYVPRRPYGA